MSYCPVSQLVPPAGFEPPTLGLKVRSEACGCLCVFIVLPANSRFGERRTLAVFAYRRTFGGPTVAPFRLAGVGPPAQLRMPPKGLSARWTPQNRHAVIPWSIIVF
jgi:hypothetical protein